jgi:hypothetical protein
VAVLECSLVQNQNGFLEGDIRQIPASAALRRGMRQKMLKAAKSFLRHLSFVIVSSSVIRVSSFAF